MRTFSCSSGSWLAQSFASWTEFTERRFGHQRDSLSWFDYLGSSDFWERTMQNWQSEFLAVASMAILAVYLRQRGSPESKPVGAPQDATDVSGQRTRYRATSSASRSTSSCSLCR